MLELSSLSVALCNDIFNVVRYSVNIEYCANCLTNLSSACVVAL